MGGKSKVAVEGGHYNRVMIGGERQNEQKEEGPNIRKRSRRKTKNQKEIDRILR